MPAAAPSSPPEPVSVALIVKPGSERIEATIHDWLSALSTLKRESELIVVSDGVDAASLEAIERHSRQLVHLRQESSHGTGFCVRAALAAARHPIFVTVTTDYPYVPGDLKKLLEPFGQRNEELNMTIDVVNGCRTGRPVPGFWKAVGWFVRQFYRFALGNPRTPLPGWLGWREHAFNSRMAWVFGNPFVDLGSSFKVFRKSRIESFPLQCNSDFVFPELIVKLTFLTTLMAEIPLSPKPDPIPKTDRRGAGLIFNRPLFRHPEPIEKATEAPVDLAAGVAPEPNRS